MTLTEGLRLAASTTDCACQTCEISIMVWKKSDKLGRTYLSKVGAQRLLAQRMNALGNGGQGLTCVDIGTGRNPDSAEAWVGRISS